MEVDLLDAVSKFYNTNDPQTRLRMHEFLVSFQEKDNSWVVALQILQTNQAVEILHFAASCLYHRLKKDCSGIFVDHFLFIKDLLIRLCEEMQPAMVRQKLFSVMGLFVLQTVPDMWESPLRDLAVKWMSKQTETLLRVLGIVPTELDKFACPLDRRNLLRSVLYSSQTLITDVLRSTYQQAASDKAVIEAAVGCVESWVTFGITLDQWKEVVKQYLSCVVDPAMITMVSKLFCAIAVVEDLYKHEQFMLELFDYFRSLEAFLVQVDPSDEAYYEIAQMVVTLAENHSDFMLDHISDGRVMLAMKLLLNFTKSAGVFAEDETVSELPHKFWHCFFDDVSLKVSRASEGPSRDLVKMIYGEVKEAVLVKTTYPPDYDAKWSSITKEQFEKYRCECADTLSCCYRILGDEMMATAYARLSSICSQSDVVWQTIEVILFLYESIADYVSVEQAGQFRALNDVLPYLFHYSARLCNPILRLVCKYAHLICDQKLYETTLPIILSAMYRAETAEMATQALSDLIGDKDPVLVNYTNEILQAAASCFNNTEYKNAERLLAVSCIGYILSLQSLEYISEYVEKFLAPRLLQLENVNGWVGNSDWSKYVLFELDVIAALVSSLDPQYSVAADVGHPVFFILKRCFEVFQLLQEVKLCHNSRDVAVKICLVLQHGLMNLSRGAADLVDSYCNQIAFLFPSHPCALQLAKHLILIFFEEEKCEGSLSSLFNYVTCKVSDICDADHTDEVAVYLHLCFHLAKKSWKFLEQKCNICLAINIAYRSLGLNESPVVQKASHFVLEVLRHRECSRVENLIATQGTFLVVSCFERIKVELLTGCLESLADILFSLVQQYNQFSINWLNALPKHPLVVTMFREVTNKRKFREYAKKINLECRRGILNF